VLLIKPVATIESTDNQIDLFKIMIMLSSILIQKWEQVGHIFSKRTENYFKIIVMNSFESVTAECYISN